MNKQHKIQIKINGVNVKGVILHRSEADIFIEITEPYTNMGSGCHIPYFSRPINSFLTEYGDKMAENLLKYLYELGWYMETNRKFIKLQFALHFLDEDYSDQKCRDRFFNSTFPFIVPIDTRDDVVRSLI